MTARTAKFSIWGVAACGVVAMVMYYYYRG
jgi:hypothetical protein